MAVLTAILGFTLLAPSAVAAGASWRSLEGTLVVAHGEDWSKGSPRPVWFTSLKTSSGEVKLAFAADRPAGFLNGVKVRVRGQMAGNTLTVGPNRADAQAVTVAAASTGAKKLAVLLVKFDALAADPYTVSTAQGVIFNNANSVANYFAEESYGLMTVSGDVFGTYTISIDTTACNYTDIGNKARAAAAAAGVDLSSYTQIQYVHSYLSSCGWSGLAYVPGRDSWLNQALNLRVSAHELSHNYGVHHASTMSCTEGGIRVSLSANSANCTSSEYGDPFSVMGAASTRHTHNQQLASMGWITGGNLQTITTAGNYTIGAAENVNATSPRGVRVARGNGTWFYLELRMPFGTYFDNFSAGDAAVNGVSIRISNDWTTIIQSQLIDTTPATTSFGDAPLAVGAGFTDPVSGVTITTLSVSGGVATVNVTWGADTIAPSAPGAISVAATGTNTARLTWGAATDNRGVTGYEVRRDGNLVGTVTTTQFDDAGLNPGTSYQYSVTAKDGAGNSSTPTTRSWTQPIADSTPPSQVTGLAASWTKSKTTLSWNAATDNVGVTAYRVYRNGVLVATVTTRTWSEARQRLGASYYVRAVDAAGNVGLASASVIVPKK
jgi:hypothetical protein